MRIFYYSLFTAFLLSLGFSAGAQDTIVVQTLTLDSDARAGVFEFPDGSQSYEKILMRYQMRCHDAAVGSGNVGCREWDYSCNTFITDSTRVDSSRATHPNYLITNFSGNIFEYTNSPSYTYYQYLQQAVNYTDTLSETSAILGTGAGSMDLLTPDQASNRQVFLLSPSELMASGLNAGAISGLYLDVAQAGQEMNFLRIRMKNSNSGSLDPAQPELDDFTEVYFQNTDFPNTGPQQFRFYQDFIWDGSSGILIDLSFTNNSGASTPPQVLADPIIPGEGIQNSSDDYSLYFSGAGAISPNIDALASVTNEITVALWVKGNPDIYPANSTLCEGVDANNNRQLNIHLPWGNGQVYWDCGGNGSNYNRINKQAEEADYEGEWNHWAFTKNATTGEMKIYLNGELWHSGTGMTNPIDIQAMQLGASNSWNQFYYGHLDEFQIWNKELDQTSIQEWMYRSIDASHPNYNQLVCYYPSNDGSGLVVSDASPLALDGLKTELPAWRAERGASRFKEFTHATMRPKFTLIQGEYIREVEDIAVLDSVQNTLHRVIEFGVNNSALVTLDTFYAYPAGFMPVFDASGMQVDSILVGASNSLDIFNLIYYNKIPAKYEILSLVTPYGNGLDLGQQGKVFLFDVTDYTPILKGTKRLSVELGGQNQEELDIQFLFITGTPPRDVIDIQNIWPFARGWYANIQNDDVFEPRTLTLNPNAVEYSIRSSITGHGQNGEFIERQHYINLDGGDNEFVYNVWKKCGGIPIYPQGGTWLFDRAGWCPGDPTDVHRFDLSNEAVPGEPVEIDYGVLGDFMTEANYLVSNQLVSYGSPHFVLDAAVTDVIRPSLRVEHERFNPACNTALIEIRNSGMETLTSLTITYSVAGGSSKTYEWTGSLAFLESTQVELPVDDPAFYDTGQSTELFEVSISNPNGTIDAYPNNNYIKSEYKHALKLLNENILNYKTNTRGEENTMRVRNDAGELVLERNFMENNTEYTDQLELPAGCYTLEFEDTGGDGLYYWYWDAINLNVGSGFLRIRRKLNSGIFFTVKNFEPEFGNFVQFDFIVPQVVGAENPIEDARLMSVYPNPTTDAAQVDLVGFEGENLLVELYDATGQLLEQQRFKDVAQHQLLVRFDLAAYPAGLYYIRVNDGKKIRSSKLSRL
jgi:hypothetical protein